MILWFGNKKKRDELEAAGETISAENAARAAAEAKAEALRQAQDEAARLAKEAALRQAQDEEARIAETVRAAAVAWEERQKREAREAEAVLRQAQNEEKREEAAAQKAKAEAELKLLEDRRLAEISRAEALRQAQDEAARRAELEAAALAETKMPGFTQKLSTGLTRSTAKLTDGLKVFTRRKLDDGTLEDLEDLLIMSDLGTAVAARVTARLAKDRFDKEISEDEIKAALASEITDILAKRETIIDFADGPRPRVVLFVGVNGSGKTTTIGKIASKLTEQGAKALLVAGDTFRAAAIEQLTVWGTRAGIPVLSKDTGADAAGLVFEAIEQARRDDLDLVLVDTAGRLQNKTELMEELAKIIRVVKKLDPAAPHDVILVLDATVGQNALSQVEAFRETAGVTGLVMTKLDGTAKGGVLVAIAEAHDLPIHFIGVGEKAEDLKPFSAVAFARALVGLEG